MKRIRQRKMWVFFVKFRIFNHVPASWQSINYLRVVLLGFTLITQMWFTIKLSTSQFQFVGNKAKGRISKRVFQENKARQNFRKTNISYPLIRTCTWAYQLVWNFHFSEIWRALFSWNARFEIRPFALLSKVSIKI